MTVRRTVAPTKPSPPMNLDQVNALFAQLGPVLNPLAIEANAETKAWGIALEEDLMVLAQFDEEKGCLVLSTEVGAPAPGDRTALYELLLRANYHWDATGGVRLAINGPDGEVFQVVEIPVDGSDATRLSAIVTSYAESAKAWREIVQGLASGSAPPPEALPANPGLRL